MNQSINDEAVCRTAPATPGLLKSYEKNNKSKSEKEGKLVKRPCKILAPVCSYKKSLRNI